MAGTTIHEQEDYSLGPDGMMRRSRGEGIASEGRTRSFCGTHRPSGMKGAQREKPERGPGRLQQVAAGERRGKEHGDDHSEDVAELGGGK